MFASGATRTFDPNISVCVDVYTNTMGETHSHERKGTKENQSSTPMETTLSKVAKKKEREIEREKFIKKKVMEERMRRKSREGLIVPILWPEAYTPVWCQSINARV